MNVRKTVSAVSQSAQKCTHNFAPPLLLSVPRDNGLVTRKTGSPLSLSLIIINSATLIHFSGLSMQIEYHFFSDPSPGNYQRPAGIFSANINKSAAAALHSHSLFSDLHMTSLKIDNKNFFFEL